MNKQFYELPEEKQQRIINSAMEVFSLNEYKRASTDLIAARAGISKGLLFYYFHNKKELYLFIFDYCMKISREAIEQDEFSRITDFFDVLAYGARTKLMIGVKNPYLTDFILRAYYSEHEDVSADMKRNITELYSESYQTYFANLDYSKFKEGIDIKMIYNMLLWMGDGYINEKRRAGQKLEADKMVKEFDKWMIFFKKMIYRDE